MMGLKKPFEQAAGMREFPYYPELGELHRGKVRDNYTKNGKIISIATDRVSAFDVVFDEPIPCKGQVLTQIAKHFFKATQDMVQNHVIDNPDPQVLVVKECRPFQIEFIIRGYLAGGCWKDYSQGKRTKSGIILPEGMQKNQQFEKPIITNTTKAKTGHDMDITTAEILQEKLLAKKDLAETERIMHALYTRGVQMAGKRNLILADTKYEIGLDSLQRITLIDEVHTPDSSRYWQKETYSELFAQGKEQKELSKEFLRDWLRGKGFTGDAGQKKPELPLEVILETSRRYIELYERLTEEQLKIDAAPVHERIINNLRANGYLKNWYVQIIAGSKTDALHYEAIARHLESKGIPYGIKILSAHKNTRELLSFLDTMNSSAEPVVYIAVAGKSNALCGIIASNSTFPVINCPYFKDTAAYQVDIHSSLRMPSKTPAMTVLDPENAALAAHNILKMTGGCF